LAMISSMTHTSYLVLLTNFFTCNCLKDEPVSNRERHFRTGHGILDGIELIGRAPEELSCCGDVERQNCFKS